jgi:hypothetical protein
VSRTRNYQIKCIDAVFGDRGYDLYEVKATMDDDGVAKILQQMSCPKTIDIAERQATQSYRGACFSGGL